ncbi:MAG: sulfatase, partial [Paenibacillus sp.]|nr:sulfatase [Paenibacillus sp.]
MSKRPPNVLLITADQLRYDCIGSSGQYPVRTPHLDMLASQSAVFSGAFSHIPVCCPARQSLLHGRRAETFGALWNFNGALPVASLTPEHYTWT